MTLPQPFIDYTAQLFGEETWQRYLASFDEETPVSIRLNKGTTLANVAHLPIGERIPWSERGYYLTERPQFTLDPLLHAGAYYVQEASSQYLDQVLREVTKGLEINYAADFCAAPGGKSLIIKDYLPDGATLISNEYVRKRAWILAENIEKAQLCEKRISDIEHRLSDIENRISNTENRKPRILVTNNSTSDLARCGIVFDLIVCDVPCSGEGMFRKDRETIKEWSQENVMKCAQLQREIVSNAWQCLREGGVLVYSTCTFNRYEDEDNMLYIIKELGGEVISEPRKFIPGIDRGEGQFMVALRKAARVPHEHDKSSIETQGEFLRNSKRVPKKLQTLNVVPSTLPEIPADAPRCDVPLQTAQNYLRGQAVILPPDTPKGIVAITHNSFFLGPAKNIGTRANNLYPKEWRIKHL